MFFDDFFGAEFHKSVKAKADDDGIVNGAGNKIGHDKVDNGGDGKKFEQEIDAAIGNEAQNELELAAQVAEETRVLIAGNNVLCGFICHSFTRMGRLYYAAIFPKRR